MEDRAYQPSKPAAAANGTSATTNGGATTNPTSFPANKAQLYNATRPTYRPQPPTRRHRRGCCCSCCLWTTFFLVTVVLLAAIAGAVFYVLYRPQRPSFSVSSLQLSNFKLSSTKLTSNFNVTVLTHNPNKKISFIYDSINLSFLSDDIEIGDGTLPSFVHHTKNTTTLKAVVKSSGKDLDSSGISTLRSNLKKNKNTMPLKIKLDTKLQVKIGSMKTKKVGIRVTCNGIQVAVPTGKSPSRATTSNVKCKADLRIKIWKWTF